MVPMPTDEEILAAGPWWQRITFPSGLTVGEWWTDTMYASLCDDIDLQGRTVLDIGCNSGVGTLWLEQQGAQVHPCDVEARWEGKFALVKQAFGLRAVYDNRSIYDLTPAYSADVVIMAGVYYHLEHPLLGLRKAWDATDGILCVEGEIIPGEGSFARFTLNEYRGNSSNWWVPTYDCLCDWLTWLPGEKRMEDMTPPDWCENRVMFQLRRLAASG